MTEKKPKALKRKSRRGRLDRRTKASAKHEIRTTRGLEAVLQVHDLLKRGNIVTTRRLEEELGASRRTVLRTIERVRDRFGGDIVFDHDAGGYRYDGNPVRLPEPMLTEGDLIALYVAAPILAQYRGTELGAQFEKSFEKIVACLPESTRSRMYVPGRVEAKEHGPIKPDAKTFSHLLNALNHDRRLEIIYSAAYRTSVGPRIVDPYVLYVVSSRWYLLAHDHRRKTIIPFAVERIWEARELSQKFQRPLNFSAQEHLRDSFGIYRPPADSNEAVEEIRIRFDALSARYVKNMQWHHTQQVKDLPDHGIELTIKVRGTVEVERFVLAWGEHAELLAPQSLRERMRDRLQRALARYAPNR